MLHAHVACLMSLTQNNQKQQNFKIHFVFLLSYVTFHYRQQPLPEPDTLILLTLPLCRVGWSAKSKNTQNKYNAKIIETFKKMSSSWQILVICFFTQTDR